MTLCCSNNPCFTPLRIKLGHAAVAIMKRWMLGGGGAALLATAAYLAPGVSRSNDVYAMPVADVHRVLAAMRIPTDADGPLGAYPAIKTDDAPTKISWAGGPRGAIACSAQLIPVSAGETRVDLNCASERPDSREAVALAAGAVAAIALAPTRPAPAEPEPAQFDDPSAPRPPSTLPLPGDPPAAPQGGAGVVDVTPVG